MDNAIMVTTGKIFKHYYVNIHLHRDINIRQIISIECKNRENQEELFDYINHKYDDLKFGDVTNLKFANEVIESQRGRIAELKKENGELKMIIEEDVFAKEEGFR